MIKISAGEDISDYKVDIENKEIVIKKNVFNLVQRKEPCFQLIRLPIKKVESLIDEDKIKVRIQYKKDTSDLIFYNYRTKKYTLPTVIVIDK